MVQPRAVFLVLFAALLASPLAIASDDAPDLESAAGIKKALASRDGSVRLAAARAAESVQDKILTAPLVKLLKDDLLPIREAAVDALIAREEEKERKAAAKAMAALLKPLDDEPKPVDIAREDLLVPALHDLAQPISMKALLDLNTLAPDDLVKARLRAVANVPSKDAIEALIDHGARRRRGDGHRRATADALRYATGENVRGDIDRWRDWWRDNESTFDLKAAARRRANDAASREERAARQEEKRRQREERQRQRPPRDGDTTPPSDS